MLRPCLAPSPTSPVAIRVDRAPSPFGELWLYATDAGLVAIGFGEQADPDERAALGRRFRAGVRFEAGALPTVCAWLEAYFAGAEPGIALDVDLRGLTPFQQRVLVELLGVGFGRSCSYAGLAARVGLPRGARAVGNALGRNPIPIVVPCHRVLHAGGGLGGYTGGLDRKRLLLDVERAAR